MNVVRREANKLGRNKENMTNNEVRENQELMFYGFLFQKINKGKRNEGG